MCSLSHAITWRSGTRKPLTGASTVTPQSLATLCPTGHFLRKHRNPKSMGKNVFYFRTMSILRII
jgi:hypothetical protein